MSVAAEQPSSRHEAARVPGSAPQHVAVAAAVDDALARGDDVALAACFAPQVRYRSGGGETIGRDEVTARLMRWRRRHRAIEVLPTRLVADADSVAWERIVVTAPVDADVPAGEATCATLVVCGADGAVVEQTDVWVPAAGSDPGSP